MEKINVVVCGDSWMCRDSEFPGTHFSELLEDRYSVTNLARAGVSNVEIGFQLKRAVELRPDYVIIAKTSPDRIEIPIVSKKQFSSSLKLEHFRSGNERHYISSNITTIISQSSGFVEFKPHLNSMIIEAVKQYFSCIYSYPLKKETDDWIIGYWLSQLTNRSILHHVVDQTFPVYVYKNINSPIYHTDFDTQKIAAKWVNDYLNKIFDKELTNTNNPCIINT
jgi:hypothetical protein